MKNLSICFVIINLALFSCGINQSQKVNFPELDTLKIPDLKIESKFFEVLPVNYSISMGIVIPNYLVVKDVLPVDLNHDMKIDTVAIFSPIMLDDVKYSSFYKDSMSRYLVLIINDKKNSRIGGIFSNVISDIPGVLSNYAGMKLTTSGFEIMHNSGGNYAWMINCEFEMDKYNNLVLMKIKKTCSVDGKEEQFNYTLSQPASMYSIRDSIHSNCNCDLVWTTLERK